MFQLVAVHCRLFNRDELLCAINPPKHDISDESLILSAYALWGQDCLWRFDGDFGFAIHDKKLNEVFLACDHIGARSLYWTQRGPNIFCATSLSGLLRIGNFKSQVSQERIARFLHTPYEARHESFLQGIEAVGPGHWVRIRNCGVTRTRWWEPANLSKRDRITAASADEELRDLTRRAVEVRLPADGRVGAHVSGGVDSTLVTSMATSLLQASGRNLAAAYTWSPPIGARNPDMGPHDERRVIQAQCEALGVKIRFGGATEEAFDKLAQQPLELQGTADLMDELPIIEQAHADGIEVMLSGWGGDEVFSNHGIGHIGWLFRRGQFRDVLRVSRRLGGGFRRPHRMAAFLWRNALVPSLPDCLWHWFSPFDYLYAEGAFPSEAMKQIYAKLEHPSSLRIVPDADAYMRGLLLNGHIGERMATWAAWAEPFGLEYRYPLTDRRLLEFVLSLPRNIRFGDGTSRHLVRRAFGDILPTGVSKQDLANERLRSNNRLAYWRALALRVKQGRFDLDCPWLDMPALRRAMVQQPPVEKVSQISTFARIFVAVRVYEMYQRQLALNSSA